MWNRWAAVVLALVLGVVLAVVLFRPAPRRQPVGPEAAPFIRHSGAPQRSALIDLAMLDREVPPAPADTVAYDIREPLRNGRAVERKSRWLYVPEGAKIRLARAASGKLTIAVPVGTMLWKEFYLRTAAGPRLVERRILRKVEPSPEKNGGLANGGWRFWTAHFLPPSADGVHGFSGVATDALDAEGAGRWIFQPEEWLPTREKSAMTQGVFKDQDGAAVSFVFPGKTNCEYCHAGAAASFEPSGEDVLSFGIHPENVTVDSLRAFVAKGWIDAPRELLDELTREPPPPADPATFKVTSMLRNNCLSCHNPSPRSAGRETAFSLEPGVAYTRAQLGERLAERARFVGPLGKPIVTPGKVEQSEILLRLRGEQGRRRMPPTEGGVPDPDLELGRIVEGWISVWN
jgi:hypothetical protein